MCKFRFLRKDRIARLAATGLATGYSPVAPGTAGSLLALLVLWFLHPAGPVFLLLGLGLLFPLGVWASGRVEREEVQKGRKHDPSIVNIDEIMGMGMSVIFLPGSASRMWLFAGFLLFRFFDIVKPFPIDRSQRLPGGWGIMMDDVIAGIYANIILQALVRIFQLFVLTPRR
jgi:phosphatidylglycerophosphatase A